MPGCALALVGCSLDKDSNFCDSFCPAGPPLLVNYSSAVVSSSVFLTYLEIQVSVSEAKRTGLTVCWDSLQIVSRCLAQNRAHLSWWT